ncbi:MAG: 16S rRNA (uracil(1498)-N(3))-methyltransferase [Candidatus Omnitrophota bacterium]|nr:16S rRNA (uracil(1498)-N(3))-methyltransferase [Candidatus Omnitrophota bacterium]
MSRFYIPKESVKGKEICVSGKEAHHILDVMRLKEADRVVVFDGTGREYSGVIKEAARNRLSIGILETREILSKTAGVITLIQSIPKKEKMDYIVEKATELGVSRIMPVLTGRTIPKWGESKKGVHVERWRKIAKEASKQCGRADIPAIGDITEFQDCLKDAGGHSLSLIAALDDDSMKLKDVLHSFNGDKISIAIGPEGDFTADEIRAARESGFKLISLGQRVLKSDTAGLSVLAVLNYEYSD